MQSSSGGGGPVFSCRRRSMTLVVVATCAAVFLSYLLFAWMYGARSGAGGTARTTTTPLTGNGGGGGAGTGTTGAERTAPPDLTRCLSACPVCPLCANCSLAVAAWEAARPPPPPPPPPPTPVKCPPPPPPPEPVKCPTPPAATPTATTTAPATPVPAASSQPQPQPPSPSPAGSSSSSSSTSPLPAEWMGAWNHPVPLPAWHDPVRIDDPSNTRATTFRCFGDESEAEVMDPPNDPNGRMVRGQIVGGGERGLDRRTCRFSNLCWEKPGRWVLFDPDRDPRLSLTPTGSTPDVVYMGSMKEERMLLRPVVRREPIPVDGSVYRWVERPTVLLARHQPQNFAHSMQDDFFALSFVLRFHFFGWPEHQHRPHPNATTIQLPKPHTSTAPLVPPTPKRSAAVQTASTNATASAAAAVAATAGGAVGPMSNADATLSAVAAAAAGAAAAAAAAGVAANAAVADALSRSSSSGAGGSGSSGPAHPLTAAERRSEAMAVNGLHSVDWSPSPNRESDVQIFVYEDGASGPFFSLFSARPVYTRNNAESYLFAGSMKPNKHKLVCFKRVAAGCPAQTMQRNEGYMWIHSRTTHNPFDAANYARQQQTYINFLLRSFGFAHRQACDPRRPWPAQAWNNAATFPLPTAAAVAAAQAAAATKGPLCNGVPCGEHVSASGASTTAANSTGTAAASAASSSSVSSSPPPSAPSSWWPLGTPPVVRFPIVVLQRRHPRKMLNIDDLLRRLQSEFGPRGHSIRLVADPEREADPMSIDDNMAALHDAGLAIGMHGAHLFHTVWMPPGASVVELLPAPLYSSYSQMYRFISKNVGLQYHSFAVPVPPDKISDNGLDGFLVFDYTIPLDSFMAFIAKLVDRMTNEPPPNPPAIYATDEYRATARESAHGMDRSSGNGNGNDFAEAIAVAAEADATMPPPPSD